VNHHISQKARLLQAIFGIEVSTSKETSLKLPIGGRWPVIDVKWIYGDTCCLNFFVVDGRRVSSSANITSRFQCLWKILIRTFFCCWH
jgi:hypothetical protein